jgi:hypothetical protein
VADGFREIPIQPANPSNTNGITRIPENNPSVHFTHAFSLLGSVSGEGFVMTRGPDRPAFHPSSGPEELTPTARVQALLNHIRALDQSMNEARLNKIEKIKKALADGTYHVSAAEVARKIIDNMREP